MIHQELNKHIDYIIESHTPLFSTTPEKSIRFWDKETPYSIHPLWCATTLATETELPKDVREEGIITLLYHDVLEDTTRSLPSDIPSHIRQSIQDMTFPGGIQQEMEEIWDKKPLIRLFKLYDKISNLLDGTWMSSELYDTYSAYSRKLLLDVENTYGQLNIVKIAHAILDTHEI